MNQKDFTDGVIKRSYKSFTEILTEQLLAEGFSKAVIEDNFDVTEPMKPANMAARVMNVVQQIVSIESFDHKKGPYIGDTADEALDKYPEMGSYLSDPDITKEEKKELIEAIRQGGIYINHYHVRMCPHLPASMADNHRNWILKGDNDSS